MRLAIVVPVYGAGSGGGATVAAQGFAAEAGRRGWHVEVWTTCAGSHYDWENVHPAGTSREDGVTVRRFPITQVPGSGHHQRELAIITGGNLNADEQYEWVHEGAHSEPLYAHVAAHAAEHDFILALPYASSMIHYASWAAPEKLILWPCLHDEPYAYLQPARLLLEHVCGVTFNSPEEATLACARLRFKPRRAAVAGVGVSPLATTTAPPVRPASLLYVGRLEAGKNLQLLYDYVRRYAEDGGEIELLVAGNGPLTPPPHLAFRHLGYISDAEKAQTLGSVLALCQPSLNESFSLTIMESWLAGRPVLVHSRCEVTRGHVQRSQGGLWFESYEEFAGAYEWLQANGELAQRMGVRGRAYVEAHYTWPAVLDRFAGILEQWRDEDGE
jgi:O-antigen biosynthesis protein